MSEFKQKVIFSLGKLIVPEAVLLSGHFSLQSSNRLAAPGWKTKVFLSLRLHNTENALQHLMLTATTILATSDHYIPMWPVC